MEARAPLAQESEDIAMRRALLLATILLLALAAPVAAAVPNESPGTATVVALPSTTTQDTTSADRIDPAETAQNDACGAPGVEHGVWFELTPTADSFVSFDVSGSDYPVGLMLFVGEPALGSLVTCGPNRVVEALSGGTTYRLMTFGFDDTAAPSGELVLRIAEAVPPPVIELTVDRAGFVDRQGLLRLSGTATCTSEDGSGALVELVGDITQRVGRLLIHGSFGQSFDAPCDGAAVRWEAFAVGENGIFAGGKAATVAVAFGCSDFCSNGFAEARVQLRRSGK